MDYHGAATPDAASKTSFADITLQDGVPAFSGTPTATFGTVVPGRIAGAAQGVFARWHWDGTRLTAETDPYGFFSLYYCIEGDRLRVSPSLLQLAALGCDLTKDRRARSVFHRLGIFVGDDTPFSAIKVLPPGGKLTWANGTVTIDAPAPSVKPNNISRAAAVDGFIELFRQSVARTLEAWDGPIVLPLSGGRDSRHILLELAHQGRMPETCITFQHGGDRWNAEVKAARAVAEAVGVRHDVLGHERSRQIDNIRAIVLTELCADEHAQMMPMHDFLIGRNVASYDGIAGDVLTEGADHPELCHKLFMDGDFAAIARMMMDGHGSIISATDDPRGASVLYSPSAEEHEEAVAHVAGHIALYGDCPDPNQVFWLLSRTRREISFVTRGILSPAAAVFAPYLDQDLVEFSLGLPFELKLGNPHFHDEMIFKAYPAYRSVPFEGGFTDDPPRSTPLRHKLRSALDIARVAKLIAPGAPIDDMKALFGRGRPLNRGANEMYHLHHQVVEHLTPAMARELIGYTDRINASRTDDLVSNSYIPDE